MHLEENGVLRLADDGKRWSCADRFSELFNCVPKGGCRGRMAPDCSLMEALANLC